MNEAVTIQEFQALLDKEDSRLVKALRELMKLEEPEDISTIVEAILGWRWR